MNIIELMAGTSSASVGDPGSFPPHGSMAPQCRTELSRRRILKISVVRKHVLTSRTGRRLGVFCCFFWEVRSFSHPFLFRAVWCFFFFSSEDKVPIKPLPGPMWRGPRPACLALLRFLFCSWLNMCRKGRPFASHLCLKGMDISNELKMAQVPTWAQNRFRGSRNLTCDFGWEKLLATRASAFDVTVTAYSYLFKFNKHKKGHVAS